MTGRTSAGRVVVFRRLSPERLPVALFFRAFFGRVIFMEPMGVLRRAPWMERLKAWGLEWLDVHAVPGLRSDLYPNLDRIYASALMERIFNSEDFHRFHALFPADRTSPAKARSVIHHALAGQISPVASAYAIAERFLAAEAQAYVCHPHSAADTLIAAGKVTEVRNLWPGGWPGLLVWAVASVAPWAIRRARSAVAKVLGARRRTEPALVRPLTDGREDVRGEGSVLYFPHQGLQYSDAYRKDQYYEADPASPFHIGNICHLELDTAGETRRRTEESYRQEGVSARFLSPRRRLGSAFSRAAARALWSGPLTATNVAKWQFMVGAALSVDGYRNCLQPFSGACLALLGFDFNFPAAAVFALQSLGIRVAASQERYNYMFQPFYAPGFDVYFVSGTRIKALLADNANAAVDTVAVTGDLRAPKITLNRAQATAEKSQRFARFRNVCLVIDHHSVTDPFADRLICGPDWESNAFFYDAICDLAERHPDCAFVLRSKDLSWQEIPALQTVSARISRLANVSVDSGYIGFDRPYQLAAMADIVVARYSSLCDQCLAAGVPVLIYTELPGTCEGPQLTWLRPYDVVVDARDELFSRFAAVLTKDTPTDPEKLADLREGTYGCRPDDDPSAPLDILHRHLHALLEPVDDDRGAKHRAASKLKTG